MSAMIDEKALRDKHFCCVNRRFLCIILRDAHSFSCALPQVFPQASWNDPLRGSLARCARERVVDSLRAAGYMTSIILRRFPRAALRLSG